MSDEMQLRRCSYRVLTLFPKDFCRLREVGVGKPVLRPPISGGADNESTVQQTSWHWSCSETALPACLQAEANNYSSTEGERPH